MKILIVEDNEKISKYITDTLIDETFSVDQVYDGETGERRIMSGTYDAVILDVMLPKKDGLAVCKSVRAQGSVIPILMLTALGEIKDRVLGLDSGADDYLIKPFALAELVARIKSLLRRPTETVLDIITVQDIVIETASHTVYQGNNKVMLTLKEYAVLEYLMRNAGKVVTREQLLEHCWDFAYNAFSNITDVYIKQLRQKLEKKQSTYIKTIRGVGYVFQTK